MLKLDHIDVEVLPTVLIDEYVPISATIPDEEAAATFYWRVTPDDQTLIEIGISGASGRLRSITVTIINCSLVSVASVGSSNSMADEQRGIPCFNISSWLPEGDFGTRFQNDDVKPCLIIYPRYCSIKFKACNEPAMSISAGQLRFVFDEFDVLVRIDLLNVRQRELQLLSKLGC